MASLLHPDPLMDNIFARSSPFPLNPVIFEDTIGITKIADAFIESSPKPNAAKQAVCQHNEIRVFCFVLVLLIKLTNDDTFACGYLCLGN